MLASELIKVIQKEINEHGDMPILIRHCSEGCDWDECTVLADPPSKSEKKNGIVGTIDISVY